MVKLSGACFWFWGGFHSFLRSCGVSQQLINKYPRQSFNKYDVMRNILDELESQNQLEIIQTLISGYYRLNGPVDKDDLDIDKAKSLLVEFRDLVGSDPIERAIHDQKKQREIEDGRTESKQIQDDIKRLQVLHDRFMSLHKSEGQTPQKKGFSLEVLFFDLLEYEEFEFTRPFRPNGEQIDGHFRYEKFDYLVEIKWIKEQAKQADLSIFDGKIRGKAQSTRGLFLAVNGFDENAVKKFTGDSPRIILMDGKDLISVLLGHRTFFDLLKLKVDALVRYGNVYRSEL